MMAVEAVQLFLQSLPPNCEFEIISFGSRFDPLRKDKKPYIYN
jgi:hypothetical protein